jgi:hypothetical protein
LVEESVDTGLRLSVGEPEEMEADPMEGR